VSKVKYGIALPRTDKHKHLEGEHLIVVISDHIDAAVIFELPDFDITYKEPVFDTGSDK
jgi:hypothetical protein